MTEVDEEVGTSFEDEYEDFQKEWDDANRMIQRGGNTIRQQELKIGESRFRIVDPAKFFSAWIHSVQDKDGKWRRLVCHGRKEIMSNKNLKPRMDPEACPVCEHVLAMGNTVMAQRGYPSIKFFFRVFSRQQQEEARAQGVPCEIMILEIGPQLLGAISSIANSPDFMEDLWEDEAKTIKKIDPKDPTKQAQRINLTKFDIIIKKEKTGKEDKDVKYTAFGSGQKGWGPFSEEEQELIKEGVPSVDYLVAPSSKEKIDRVLFGKTDEEEEPGEARGRRTSKAPKEAGADDVEF